MVRNDRRTGKVRIAEKGTLSTSKRLRVLLLRKA